MIKSIGAASFVIAWGFTTPNGMLICWAAVSMWLIWWLSIRERAIIDGGLFAFFSWLQSTIAVFHASLLQMPLVDFLRVPNVERVTFWSILFSVAVALGFYAIALKRKVATSENAMDLKLKPFTIVMLYALFSLLALAVQTFSFGALGQLAFGFGIVQSGLLFWLTVVVVRSGRGWVLWTSLVAYQLFLGISGYFSSFKELFALLIVALLVNRKVFQLRHKVVLVALCSGLFVMLVAWSSNKDEHRLYLSGGIEAQAIKVTRADAATAFAERMINLSDDSFATGVDRLTRRTSYVEFFGYTLDHVPAVVPHEAGGLITDAFLHVVTPRILFPNKPALEPDTVVTARYTGLQFHGSAATSISLGLPGLLYVDFGLIGMVLAALGIGLAVGGAQRLFASVHLLKLAPGGALVSIMLAIGRLEITPIKFIGSLIALSAASYLLIQFVLLPLLRVFHSWDAEQPKTEPALS